MTGRNFTSAVTGGAFRGIGGRYSNDVVVHMRTMNVVQVTLVRIIGMVAVLHNRMAATGAVLMRMVLGMLMMGGAPESDERYDRDKEYDVFHSGLDAANVTGSKSVLSDPNKRWICKPLANITIVSEHAIC